MVSDRPVLSVVTPVFNEADNLPPLYQRLATALASLDLEWEWIAVDDHSGDDSFDVLCRLAKDDRRVRVIRLTRNFGSHAAIVCGLDAARGDAAVVMAADLQDSPENIPELVDNWHAGAQVVWAARSGSSSERRPVLSRLYERAVRRIVGADALPPSNADFLLLDRAVIDAARRSGQTRTPVFMLVASLGFRQESVECAKAPRTHGKSGWTLGKKLALAIDSIVAFSDRPLRWISTLGLLTATAGALYAAVIIANAIAGNPISGWSALMVVVLLIGGAQMLMLGLVGAYVRRAVDETHGRPRYVIESTMPSSESSSAR